MRFEPALVEGRLVRRYKRFLTDVRMPDGTVVVAHCANTGALTGCLEENARVLLRPADNPERKLRFSWLVVESAHAWVGLDTSLAVPLVVEAIEAGLVPEFAGFDRLLTEVPYGHERSRIDILLSRGGTPSADKKARLPEGDARVYVEVKNTTLASGEGSSRVARFPDAVTERGTKHLRELSAMVREGHRAAVVFVAQRSDCHAWEPADDVDPVYGATLREAVAAGVEVFAFGGRIDADGATITGRLPVRLPPMPLTPTRAPSRKPIPVRATPPPTTRRR
ncbi:MAG: DNA/RNA nuclease SfsA [Polyangiaceae bacterium]